MRSCYCLEIGSIDLSLDIVWVAELIYCWHGSMDATISNSKHRYAQSWLSLRFRKEFVAWLAPVEHWACLFCYICCCKFVTHFF
jgi:hypothetical protein